MASSGCVKRVHAVGKANDERSGSQREDTRIGMTLARVNNQSSYLQSKDPTLDPIRCTLCVKSSLEPGGTQRTKSTLSPERVHR